MNERMGCPFLEDIVESAKSVFNSVAGIEVKKDNLIVSNKHGISGDITGIVGLSNDSITGSIAISFPQRLGRILVANMLSTDPRHVSEEELEDGIGKITNMVAGAINNRMGNLFRISLPNIITGKRHLVSLPHNISPVVFKFFAVSNPFHLLATFEEKLTKNTLS